MGTSVAQSIYVDWCIAVNVVTFSLGFVVNRFLSDRTANRKEDRDLIDNISKLVSEIETKAHAYYGLPGGDKEAIKIAAEIRSLNSQIGRQVQHFSNSFSDKIVLGHVKRLKQAVTSNLDDSTRAPLEASSELFEEIARQCRMLIGDLNMQFGNKYR